jgi:cytosine/adenosine deaminase-related metal-dependent hydrolase
MVLNNMKTVGNDQPLSIRIVRDKITELSASAIADQDESLSLSFNEAIVFPGLINSHDHLDFNLFPQFGDKTYNNYTEWGNYIHQNYKEEIAAILEIPLKLRLEWGVFKNLLCGVTTVVNHGEPSGLENAPLSIFEKTQCLHSVHFEKGWRFKLNNPFKGNIPVNIHVGEGIDRLSSAEIDELTNWNLLGRKLVGVHAVAMSQNQAKKFKALVWCPQSNYFLLKKTAPVDLLQKDTDILFGTDSILTSTWDIWDHLRAARKTGLLGDEALYNTLNKNAKKTWKLDCGELKAGKYADIVIAKIKKGTGGFDSFFSITPADVLLVIHKGRIRLFDETLLDTLNQIALDNYGKIYINNSAKYVWGDLAGLMEQINGYNSKLAFPVSTTKAA